MISIVISAKLALSTFPRRWTKYVFFSCARSNNQLKLYQASQDNNTFGALQSLLKKLPIGGSSTDDKMGEADNMQAQAKAYRFDPNNVAPPEVREQLWKLMTWRDNIYRDIIKKIEMIPGLSDLIDNLTNALNACTSICDYMWSY